jgi:hypothetical protein
MQTSFHDLAIGLAACGLLACAGSASEPEGERGWQGEEPHFVLHGLLNGEQLDVRIDGAGAESGESVWCEREYEVPLVDGAADLSQARHIETAITGFATVDGEERIFQLELKRHALQADAPGTRVVIVPRNDEVEPEENEVWFEWEWQTIDEEDLFEAAAQEGTFVLGAFTGEPGEGGVIIPEGEGIVGGSADVRWSVEEQLHLSFSVRCTSNDVEEY